MTLCKTTQRAIVRQAHREGVPVWAWMIAAGLGACGGEPAELGRPDATPSQPGACIDTGDDALGTDGLIFRPCDDVDDEGVCRYRFLDGVADTTQTTTCRSCLGAVTDRAEDLESVCARYDLEET